MTTSARDGDQPGLWPLPETARRTPAKPAKRQSVASALSDNQSVGRQANQTAPGQEESLWRLDDLASYLGVPKQTIYGWRKTSFGPPPIKVGKHLRWRPAAVAEWVRGREETGR